MKIVCSIIILICWSVALNAQISHGGFPIQPKNLKSAYTSNDVYVLPQVSQNTSFSNSMMEKSLKYAETFDVNLTMENAGIRFDAHGYKIWKLHLKAADVYSLGLVFTKFKLPEDARLFVYNSDMSLVRGAFTNKNNKAFNKLALAPFPGNELIIQYEEPLDAAFNAELELGMVSQGILDIANTKNRFYPRRQSGSCNIDVNCSSFSELEDEARAVCRVYAGHQGKEPAELGTATLINIPGWEGNPVVISAFHIFDDPDNAELAVFEFNYESPSCTGIDGSDIQSISGARTIAYFDSLDFILIELSEDIPPSFQPYLMGWDASGAIPKNNFCIHHPNGDTKKISHDEGSCFAYTHGDSYIEKGHWQVQNWEEGTTEGGSSGAALFTNHKVVGTLTGGLASCEKKTYDRFARFDLMWDYKADSLHQLKYWLDPLKSGGTSAPGEDPYEETNSNCTVINNLEWGDNAIVIGDGGTFSNSFISVITGSNQSGITEICEKFVGVESGWVQGVSIGIDQFEFASLNTELIVKIYAGDSFPEVGLDQFRIDVTKFARKAMNYVEFERPVFVEGNFYVSIVIPDKNDYLAVYQTTQRTVSSTNTLYLKQNDLWKSMPEYMQDNAANASLIVEALVCGGSLNSKKDTVAGNVVAHVFPVPVRNYMYIKFLENFNTCEMLLYDCLGNLLYSECTNNARYWEIDVSSFQNGMYFLKVIGDGKQEVKRVVVSN